MKNSIKAAALVLALSAGIFAAAPAKAAAGVPVKTDVITFSSLPSDRGVEVKVEKSSAGKSIVIIYDKDGEALYKDVVTSNGTMDKGYILNKLENGDYTLEVTSNKQVVKKAIHVYDEDNTKMFIIQN